jgi:hypothetical protein
MVTQMQEQFAWKEEKINTYYLGVDGMNEKAFVTLREEMKTLADKYEIALQQEEEEIEEDLQWKMMDVQEDSRRRAREDVGG